MRIGVLGPLTVTEEGDSFNLGGVKQRTVLAMLVAHAGKSVSIDAIIEAVWGEETPSTARRNTQTYVSTLRGQMGDAIEKTSQGWRLVVESSDVDAIAFENVFSSAVSLTESNPERASVALREALGLWRGHPYVDAEAHGILDGEITRLSEMRLAAQAARIDADLALGRHAELIGEIEALSVEHPYSERFRAQHMLALYRAGRQEEALRSYQRLRTTLVDELGVDPTQDLQNLEAKILQQDESLALTPARTVQRRAVLVADPGDPIEIGHLPPEERGELLRSLASSVDRALNQYGGGLTVNAGSTTFVVLDQAEPAAKMAEALVSDLAGSGARVAIDFGDVVVEDGSVSGAPVSRAGVMAAVGHLGQVLLSPEAQQQIAAGGGKTWRYESLGAHDLPGVEDQVLVYQLLVGDQSSFPPLDVDRLPPPLPGGASRSVPGYELREPVGQGSIGTLYRAFQPSVGREVLVEVIGRSESSDLEFIRRFEADAQRLSLLDHQNIAQVIDYWRQPDGAFLVYRYPRGGFLHEASAVDAGRIIEQVGAGLAHAHSFGMVHGSLRPDRVVLDEAGNAAIVGFPIAGVGAWTSSDFAAYIAPETLRGESVTVHADLYAFAVLVNEMLVADSPEDGPLEPANAAIARAISEDPGRRHGSIREFVADLDPGEDSAPETSYTSTRNPYKGLAAFHEADAKDFFGRSSAVEELVSAIASSRFVAFVGPSGIGKSSVVRAGLIPAVRSGAIEGSERWVIADMLPGSHPFLELQKALESVAVEMPVAVRESLVAGDRNALGRLADVLPDGSQLLLVVDQFEELFTMATEAVRRDFLALLSESVENSDVRLVITMRADFLDRPLRYSEFGELLEHSTLLLRAPNATELAEAIARPAENVSVSVEGAVVERIVSDVGDQPGALPLMQHALATIFEARESDLIDLTLYEEVGGVRGSLVARAESVHASLDDQQRIVAKQLFLRLVSVTGDGPPTRQRVRLTELEELDAVDIIVAFVRARLLVTDNDPESRTPTVEVSHEALLTEWPRLSGWIDATREDLTLSRRLAESIADWGVSGRDDSYLLTRGRLSQHLAWTETTSLALSSGEREYLELSRALDEASRARLRRRRVWIMSGFGVAAALATVFGLFALRQADEADTERRRAEARGLVANASAVVDDDPPLALLLATQGAKGLLGDPLAIGVLRQMVSANHTIYTRAPGSAGFAYQGDLRPDGQHIALGGTDGLLEVRTVDSDELVWSFDFGRAPSGDLLVFPAYIEDGSFLVVSAGWFPPDLEDYEPGAIESLGVRVFNSETGAEVSRHDSECPLRFDGRTVGSSGVTGTRLTDAHCDQFGPYPDEEFRVDIEHVIFDAVTGEIEVATPPFNGNSGDISVSVAYDPMGRWQLTQSAADGPPGTVTVTDRVSGETIMDATGRLSISAAISPDGSLAVVGGHHRVDSGDLMVLDVESGGVVNSFNTQQGVADVKEFIAGGRLLVTSGADGSVKVWEPRSGTLVQSISLGDGYKNQLAVSDDETLVAVFGPEGATVVSLEESSAGGTLDTCPEASAFYATTGLVVRDDLLLAYSGFCESDEVTGTIFDLTTAEVLDQVGPADGQNMDLSHDGRYIAFQHGLLPSEKAPAGAGSVLVYDRQTGDVVEMDGLCEWRGDHEGASCRQPPEEPYAAYAQDLDFSPDDRLLVMGRGSGGPARMWDTSSGDTLATGEWLHVEFSPDGSRLFVSDGFTAEILTVDDFSELVSADLDNAVWYPRFTNDGQLVFGYEGSDVVFLNSETLEELRRMTDLHDSGIRHVEISQDGTKFATAGEDGFAKVWDVVTGDLLSSILVDPDDRVQAVSFTADDGQLIAVTLSGPIRLFDLDPQAVVNDALHHLARGFTEQECSTYDIDPCPTLEDMRSG